MATLSFSSITVMTKISRPVCQSSDWWCVIRVFVVHFWLILGVLWWLCIL